MRSFVRDLFQFCSVPPRCVSPPPPLIHRHWHNPRSENWLPLVDALRNFVFDPSLDFLALIHGLRVDPLPAWSSL